MLRFLVCCAALLFSTLTVSAQAKFPSDSRLKSISGTKIVKIAYRADATPYSFVNEKKEPVGYTIDLCRMVVSSLEKQLGVQGLKIEWVPVTVQTRFSTVANGKADMECGSSTVTLGRMKEVDFSNFVFVESTGVLVAKASNFQSFAGMAGKKIAVVSGTTNESAIKDHIRVRKIDVTLISVKDRDEGVAALESGKAEGFASDKLLIVGAKMKQPDALTMLPDDLSMEPYAIVLPRGEWAFRLAVNTGLAQIYRSGAIEEAYKQWFGRIGLRPGLLLEAAYALGSLAD